MKTDSGKILRRTLGTLQPSAEDQAVLVGSAGKVSIDKKKLDTKRRRLNFDLENKPPNVGLGPKKDKECKTPKFSLHKDDPALDNADRCRGPVVSHEAYNLMLRDDATEDYWKQLAEERRLALEKALEENQRLHENMEVLEAENKHLQKIADQCAELADIVKTLTADDEDDEVAEDDA
ncbi:geminin [Galendromus occidentalis]|uniref:Geminin n=1 Tax=Galendromus occidentalis TaxID=34638 RepID=A0AAJ6QV46_9ACAR|nr:geminin [Galendromus occidentalis]